MYKQFSVLVTKKR